MNALPNWRDKVPLPSNRADDAKHALVRRWQRLVAALRLDPYLRGLVLEAAWRLVAIRLAFAVLSFRGQRRFFGRVIRPDAGAAHNSRIALDGREATIARQVGWAVWKVERHLPVKVACLPMALVARRMLRRRGLDSVLVFGARQDGPPGDLGTHAWLDAGPVRVAGYPLADTHRPFAAFIVD